MDVPLGSAPPFDPPRDPLRDGLPDWPRDPSRDGLRDGPRDWPRDWPFDPPPEPPLERLPDHAAAEEVLRAIRSARGRARPPCPRCGAARVQRWGRFAARQRFRCTRCRRTFSDLTATPAAYTKKLGLWAAYGVCLERRLSLRQSAARLGIHPSTAFRWRRRLLAALCERERVRLGGTVACAELVLAHSEKGSRRCLAPRRRGLRPGTRRLARGHAVVFAADALGRLFAAGMPRRHAHVLDLEARLRPRLEAPLHALAAAAPGPLGPYARLARREGAAYVRVRLARAHGASRAEIVSRAEGGGGEGARRARGARRAAADEAVLAAANGAFGHSRRWRRWMRRFRGVATRYLEHYLAWYRWSEAAPAERRLALLASRAPPR